MADAVEEFDTHLRKRIPLALGGDNPAHRLILVSDRQSHQVGHIRQRLLQLQNSDFRIPLGHIRFRLVIGAGVELLLITNGSPDETGQGRNHELRDFGNIGIVEPVMKCGKERRHRIERILRSLCLLRIPLVDKELDDHVEKRNSNGIRHDDRQGQGKEILRMAGGSRESKERIEQPEKKLQDEGIQKSPHP